MTESFVSTTLVVPTLFHSDEEGGAHSGRPTQSIRDHLRDRGNDLHHGCLVPLSHFANLIEATARDVEEKGLVGPCFGHAGDGNLHCILPLLEDESAEYLEKVHQVNENLIERTLLAGGTCTGEHGVGYGKIKYLERQYGPGATIMMQMVKKGLDPYNIMNPGKVVPP
jgi:D-lactate dehydrogenase (cytochrome)